MDRLHEMQVFVAVADAGSLVKAGARLRLSPPAVTRAIASLEDRLNARLFNRTTRRLSITEAGARFLKSSKHLLAEIDNAETEAAGDEAAPHGLLTVTASVTFGRAILTPIVGAFLAAQPRVAVSANYFDRIVDLVEEGVDVAVRIGPLPDSSLVARRVGEVRRLLVASPAYLAKHGRPRKPADLKAHAIVAFTGLMPNHEIRLRDGASIALAPRLEVNDAASAIAAAEMGEGITMALSYMVARQIRERRLVAVLAEFMPGPVPVHLVYPSGRIVAPKIRAFLDFAGPRLARALRPRRAPSP